MGITWRIAMPLLSTLAALVIIVSSEDHMEKDYRYDLRPRALDHPSNYDQPWRALEAEPIMQPSTQPDSWHESIEEPLKRRRSYRKRKRRPMTNENSTPPEEEREVYPEHPPRYENQDYAETSEMPRRRRKKLEHRRNQWTDDYVEPERPFRKRSHRKKRPSINNNWHVSGDPIEGTVSRQGQDDVATHGNDPKLRDFLQESNNGGVLETRTEEPSTFDNEDIVNLKEDKSLSEFSMEAENYRDSGEEEKSTHLELSVSSKAYDKSQNIERPILITSETSHLPKLNGKVRDLLVNNIQAVEKETASSNLQVGNSTNSAKLKELLKRSNGSSLSEILQQHNLSLTDLLSGRGKAISVLKAEDSLEAQKLQGKDHEDMHENSEKTESILNHKESHEHKPSLHLASKSNFQKAIEDSSDSQRKRFEKEDLETQHSGKPVANRLPLNQSTIKIAPKRRFPSGIRRKLRLRPTADQQSLKGQPNTDLLAQTTRKYQRNRNMTKSKEWKDVISTMNLSNKNMKDIASTTEKQEDISTTTIVPEETTTETIEYSPSTITVETETTVKEEETVNTETTLLPTETAQETTTAQVTTTTEQRSRRPIGNRGYKRQYNNMRRKRPKHKIPTTEPTIENDEFRVDLFDVPNLVPSSEIIAKPHTPAPTKEEAQNIEKHNTSFDVLETTAITRNTQRVRNFTSSATPKYVDRTSVRSTTEEAAKIEIEEILNDTRTSARLSKILMERNMTLNELVEHRERGSSHVHLADIFHNASKEPSPEPEPFLSKSSIEPLAKETYPLRALLEAKHHDPNAKVTTLDPGSMQAQYVHIPVVMDFGNNVNERNENMGIMSLFNKLSSEIGKENSTINTDSEGTPYVSTVISETNVNDTMRESKTLKEDNVSLDKDVLGWNQLFELMRQNHKNLSESELPLAAELYPTESKKKIVIEEDIDGDGVIVLEDLEHFTDSNNKAIPDSGEKVYIDSYERAETTEAPGILDTMPGNTRSVTVATASIIGLSMILFLLTYAAFKWKQQRKMLTKKQSYHDERIPTPVFENRKGHKNNCSTRSISPMLNTTNIYNMSTLDSHHGSESPEYMWDSLRKPFQ